MRFVFFGTPEASVEILERLKKDGLLPTLIVTIPDAPSGRNLIPTPPPVKNWAITNNINYIQPEKFEDSIFDNLKAQNSDFFIVIAYGKIIPKRIIDLPKFGSLNIHYSILPKYRGASPIESQILNDEKHPGISIMLLDEKMDHGPIYITKEIEIDAIPTSTELRKKSNEIAGELLVQLLPQIIEKKIIPKEQNHDEATYAHKFTKADGEINLSDDPYKNFLKIQAFNVSPQTYFFAERKGKRIRVNIKKAVFENGELKILRITPEGKKEMDFKDFERSL